MAASAAGALQETVADDAAAEEQVVARARRFDEAALAEIYSTYYPKIYNYGLVHLGNVQAAEDLASEVMLRVLESIDRYHFRGVAFSAWVFRIARNRLIDLQRRRRRRREVDLPQSLAGPDNATQHVAEQSLDRSQILMALAQLTEEQRQVMVLRFLQGFDNATAGRILGRSQSAVKSLQHRALNSMRKAMLEEPLKLNYGMGLAPEQV